MPTSRIKLGHNQTFTVDDTPYEGVREIDVDVTSREVDVTMWDQPWASTLPLVTDATLTVKLYYADEMSAIWQNMTAPHPKTPLTLEITDSVSNSVLLTLKAVVSSVRVGFPMGGVVPHDVTFRMWSYQ